MLYLVLELPRYDGHLEPCFELLLVNARHVKHLPGRKTDVKDCEWLAQLLEHGLLRGSFIPTAPIRDLRDLTRRRKALGSCFGSSWKPLTICRSGSASWTPGSRP